MNLKLKGKTAIITGGSGGIGRGLLLEFAREGINVVCASRDAEKAQKHAADAEKSGFEGKILAVATDITDMASVTAMVEVCHQHFGPVDILINNAGGVAHPSTVAELDAPARNWEIELNINGVVNCVQAVAKDMLERKSGAVVNISSNSSLLGEAASNVVHYGATKGFVNSFTKGLAYEWAPFGITVNNICPGWIVPEKSEFVGDGSFWNRFGFETMGRPEQMQQALEDGTLYNMSNLPVPRLGRPEDIASLALFLSSEASSYITGQLISVSGGAYMP